MENEPLRGDVPFDSSQLKCYMTCPFQYYLKYILGLRPHSGRLQTLDIDFGQRVHTFLEKLYNREEFVIERIWDGFIDVKQNEDKTQESGIFLCGEYYKNYAENDRKYEIKNVEYCHTTDIGGYPFVVKLDTVIEFDGCFYSLEHKTTTTISANTFSRHDNDIQMYAQTNAINEKYGDCAGVIINALGIKNYKRKSSDKLPGLNAAFERHFINKDSNDCEEFKRQASIWIKRIIADEDFPKAIGGTGCTAYRGCPYQEMCNITKGLDVDEYLAGTMFEQVDPFDYLKESL